MNTILTCIFVVLLYILGFFVIGIIIKDLIESYKEIKNEIKEQQEENTWFLYKKKI